VYKPHCIKTYLMYDLSKGQTLILITVWRIQS